MTFKMSVAEKQARQARWVRASTAVGALEAMMTSALQMIGRLDVELIDADETGVGMRAAASDDPSVFAAEVLQLDRRIALSWLWVLGAYELVRTADQKFRDAGKSDAKVQDLKREFERLRVPLAKFEPARRFPSDSGLAWPLANAMTGGIVWQVAPDVYIERRELADRMLDVFVTAADAAEAERE